MTLGQHTICHWSRTQATIALSSGEAELNAALKAGCETLFLQNVSDELGEHLGAEIKGDSSASRGILLREGVGAVKHLDI